MSAPTRATSAAARAHDLRVVPEELDRHRPLVGVHDEQLVERLAVAVVDREARDHLARPPARRRSAWPAGARTSCRCRPAARASRGWGSRDPRSSMGRAASASWRVGARRGGHLSRAGAGRGDGPASWTSRLGVRAGVSARIERRASGGCAQGAIGAGGPTLAAAWLRAPRLRPSGERRVSRAYTLTRRSREPTRHMPLRARRPSQPVGRPARRATCSGVRSSQPTQPGSAPRASSASAASR